MRVWQYLGFSANGVVPITKYAPFGRVPHNIPVRTLAVYTFEKDPIVGALLYVVAIGLWRHFLNRKPAAFDCFIPALTQQAYHRAGQRVSLFCDVSRRHSD